MANNIAVSQVVATTLGLIERESTLSRISFRDAEAAFVGGVGDSVRIRIPRAIAARDGVVDGDTHFTDLNEDTVAIELTQELYSAVKLSDWELTLDIESYAKQVLQPQALGIVRDCEKAMADVMNAETAVATRTIDPDQPLRALTAAAAELVRRENGSPERHFVIGPELLEAFLSEKAIQDASAAGSADVIQAGYVGRVMGFDVHVSPYIEGAVALTPGAFALAVRAPDVPEGAGYAASETYADYAIRYLRDYVMATRAEVSLVSAFVGATALDEQRFIPFAIEGESS